MQITIGSFELELGFWAMYLKVPCLGECFLEPRNCVFDKA